MPSDITPEFTSFLKEWAMVFGIAGGVCLLLGTEVGWIIWENTCKFAEKLEEENRDALNDFERTSDEISKIRASLMDAAQ